MGLFRILLVSMSFALIGCVGGGGGGGGGGGSSQAVLPDGFFAYSDGTTYGIHGNISSNGTAYTITHYSIGGDVYQQETGTISYNGNELTFTISSSIPSGCMSGSGTWKFSNTDTTVTLEATEAGQPFSIIVSERVDYNATQAVGGTATTNCWF